MNLDQLILRKITKTVAIRFQILRLKFTKFVQLGLHLKPCWASLQHSPDSLAGLKGPTSKVREGKE